MRTRWVRTEYDGTVTSGTRDLNKEPMPNQNVLASINLYSLTFQFNDGSKVAYMAIEYECEECGKYGHPIQRCPNLQGPTDDEPEPGEISIAEVWRRYRRRPGSELQGDDRPDVPEWTKE